MVPSSHLEGTEEDEPPMYVPMNQWQEREKLPARYTASATHAALIPRMLLL